MVSKVGVGSMTYLQNMQGTKDKKGVAPTQKTKELDRVESIKEQIKNGTYQLDMNKTAQAVSDELI